MSLLDAPIWSDAGTWVVLGVCLLFIVVGIVFLITLFGNMVSWSFGVNFVAEHVLNAVERKQYQETLETAVAERTRQLAQTNADLQKQVMERLRRATRASR